MMRALRVAGPGQVAVVDLPEPRPAPDEAVVHVAYAGVCGTDRRLAARGADPPRVPGHEAAGHLDDGTPVGIHPDTGCGRCPACGKGFPNRCPVRVAIGLHRDGGLAERVAVPRAHLVPLNGIPPRLGPLLEPLACGLQAVDQLGVWPGEAALVVGAGTMGVLCTWALQAAGARVAVVQRSPGRRALAGRLGADAVLGPDGDPAAALGTPPTAAIVTAPGAEPLALALNAVAPGGRVHAFAGSPGGATVDANLVHYRHLTLVGGTGSRLADYRRAAELARSGIDLSRLPHTTVPLDEAPALLRQAPAGVLKGLVRLTEDD